MADPDQKALPAEAVDGGDDLISWSRPPRDHTELALGHYTGFHTAAQIGLEELITWYSGGTKIQKTFPCSTEICATLMSFRI